MKQQEYIVYIKADEAGRIIAVNSSAFMQNTEGWTKIDEGIGDKYHHAQGNYFELPIYDMQGCHNYIYENGQCRLTTAEEKQLEISKRAPKMPSIEDDILSITVDHEYRLTLLELGVI